MSNKYPLARLLRLRKMKEDRAANEMALAQRRELQAQEKVRRAQEDINGSSLDGDFSENSWRSSIAANAARRSMLLEAMTLAQVASTHTEEATADWQDAVKESKPLEKLEERFLENAQREEVRAESIVLDEVAQQMKKPGDGNEHGN